MSVERVSVTDEARAVIEQLREKHTLATLYIFTMKDFHSHLARATSRRVDHYSYTPRTCDGLLIL